MSEPKAKPLLPPRWFVRLDREPLWSRGKRSKQPGRLRSTMLGPDRGGHHGTAAGTLVSGR